MSSSPSISILVPIYNVEKYLRQCIESIISQTIENIEIILINDGSTDSSPEIINEYAKLDSRIKVVDKPNSGYGASMNIGLKTASGKYIGIVESDDWIEKDMFETLFKLSEKDKLDIARSEFYYYSTTEKEVNTISSTPYVPHNIIISPEQETGVFFQQPSIWSNLYLRSFLFDNNIWFLETPGASYQDTAFSFKVYSKAKRFEMINSAFYHYRIDGGSSSFQNNNKIFCICDEYEEIWKYVRANNIYDKYKYLIPHLQLNGYKWNYSRLRAPYCDEFYSRWVTEFKQLFDDKLIELSTYSEKDRHIINTILKTESHSEFSPRLSVVVPVYNMEQYLSKCLESLINQSFYQIEIICVNDGSTDNSQKILEKYSQIDDRIIILNKKNGGLSSARNMGI